MVNNIHWQAPANVEPDEYYRRLARVAEEDLGRLRVLLDDAGRHATTRQPNDFALWERDFGDYVAAAQTAVNALWGKRPVSQVINLGVGTYSLPAGVPPIPDEWALPDEWTPQGAQGIANLWARRVLFVAGLRVPDDFRPSLVDTLNREQTGAAAALFERPLTDLHAFLQTDQLSAEDARYLSTQAETMRMQFLLGEDADRRIIQHCIRNTLQRLFDAGALDDEAIDTLVDHGFDRPLAEAIMQRWRDETLAVIEGLSEEDDPQGVLDAVDAAVSAGAEPGDAAEPADDSLVEQMRDAAAIEAAKEGGKKLVGGPISQLAQWMWEEVTSDRVLSFFLNTVPQWMAIVIQWGAG